MGGSGITLIHGKVLIGGGAAVFPGWLAMRSFTILPAGTFTPTRQTRRAHTGSFEPPQRCLTAFAEPCKPACWASLVTRLGSTTP